MALSLQEISDRFEIMDILTDYCSAIDTSDFELFISIFTKDAVIDYSKAGGPCSDPKAIAIFLRENLGKLPKQHIITNQKILIDGDKADVRSLCLNPLEISRQEEKAKVAIWGIWYEDKFVRTSDGWRISKRVTEPCYSWMLDVETIL